VTARLEDLPDATLPTRPRVSPGSVGAGAADQLSRLAVAMEVVLGLVTAAATGATGCAGLASSGLVAGGVRHG